MFSNATQTGSGEKKSKTQPAHWIEKHWNAAACEFTFVLQENPLQGSYTSVHLLFKMLRLSALGLTVVSVVSNVSPDD